ncbi:hypothetical protein F0562_025258 [Nyssa sinensis]|uniref:DUF659 domain-containing protein n=1 Tax=Nyssa sinensis TaxID=561372 RepID=A0A5J5BDR8_9ASTE|nr:hypothetical protein F0562_025258 [Nyssa sinensis]
MFDANAIPFNLVKDVYFKRMLESVASYGKGLKPPSCHEVRCTFLKKETNTINNGMLENYKVEWKNLSELLDSMVEEIGEDNVVQVVTYSASAYVKAGELLMAKRKNLFWSPCAAHCLNLILTDIGDLPIHTDTISKARKITSLHL